MGLIVTLSMNDTRRSIECHYAESRYARCHYAECRGANLLPFQGNIVLITKTTFL
jgi:hypothetical protein